VTVIKKTDFIQSIADGFQFISYYHPQDYIQALAKAYDREQSLAAKDAIAQILVNSRMCAEGHRPICQDTGMAMVFLKIGMDVKWDTDQTIQEMVDEGVRQAYNSYKNNVLRASVLSDPAGLRKNTRDNTPAVVHVELVKGDKVDVHIAAKGGGSENKSKFTVLNPSDSIVEWVLKTVPTMGAGWCPPGILGIGIGGTAEKAMLLAKEALLEPVDIQELQARGAQNRVEELRLELYEKVNALGIGAQGLGGLTTVVDVKILDYPTHAASLPIAMIPNCAATRHAHFTLDGSGAAVLTPPKLEDYPLLKEYSIYVAEPPITVAGFDPHKQDHPLVSLALDAKRVNLDTVTAEQTRTWKAGDRLLLSGKLLTGRDAAHKRISDLLAKGEALPVDFKGKFIYYVGPVDAVGDEAVGPAGPTTATRMDKFTETMLSQTGLIGMVGKAERGAQAIESIAKHQAVYLMAVGGAAYLVSKAIKSAKVIAFNDLGMEAIHEFEVEDMPVTVAVDCTGESVHISGPKEWRGKIGKL